MGWVLFAIRYARWLLADLLRRMRRPPSWVGFLIEVSPAELPAPRGPFWRRLLNPPALDLRDLAARFQAVAREPRVQGVVVHLRPLQLSPARVDALRELIAGLRRAGKRVVCWAPAYTSSTYQVACAADEVLLQRGGSVEPLGVARDYVFLAEALERVGVEVDLLQITPYKSGYDALAKRGLTPEAREMAEWLAEAGFQELVGAVAEGRSCDEGAARALIDGSPYTDLQALAAGAVDGVVGEEELPGRLAGRLEGWSSARRRLPRPRPPRPGRIVGLLRVEGTILDGRTRRAPFKPPVTPPLLFEDQCGDLTLVQQARALAQSRRVGAVVLWVDSRGGSALASEAMAAALGALAAKKPLVAVMGSVAASGGYYVTTPARAVFAQPGTLTGSIGVLAGKLVAGGLLDRLLLHRELVQRGRHAAMSSPERRFTDAERAKLQEAIERSYQVFLERVAQARGRTAAEIQPVAGGRVWTGRQARERGLVDTLGGVEAALAEARRLGGLAADAPLQEARTGRRELPPAVATAPAALAHALRLVAALNSTSAWWLCPLVAGDG